MNAENLKKLVNELTDIIAKERKTVGLILTFSLAIKLGFYWLNNQYLAAPDNLEIVKSNLTPNDNGESATFHSQNTTSSLFPFYPATASHDELVLLGFSAKTANILINYRKKGGQFRSKEDVKKIYSVTPDLYHRLAPYILIQSEASSYSKESKSYTRAEPKPIDINTAGLDEWKALPGIGDYFAKKFIEKREGLGAYIDIAQIAELYRFPDSSFQKIKPFLNLKKGRILKININTASEDELRKHPYILKWQADDILRHRPIYGLNDLYELNTYSDKTKNQFVGSYFEF
jgi:DNA uptake protein ComE-like DNA-binding protein